jgi:hypothetical protein
MVADLTEVPLDQSILHNLIPLEASLVLDLDASLAESPQVPVDRFGGVPEVLSKLTGVISDPAIREAIQDTVAADQLAHAGYRMSIHPNPPVLAATGCLRGLEQGQCHVPFARISGGKYVFK